MMHCTQCGSTNFEEDRARADLICLDCGMVMSENVISSEVEFVETGAGQSAAIGRFVSDESNVYYILIPFFKGQAGNYKESKMVTENKARRRIDTICGQLRLGNDIAVSGFRYYQSALFRGLTRGRGALLVAASCIYLAARQLRVNLMLLDLSDAVGINVYVLGRVYADLKRKLHLAIPEMDPCIYIERFANQLEFGDKTSAVSTTAMRLLQRMKKDWIATGRRPSGLAAAALLISARIHEFNRTEEDVARIARISQQTAKKRLEEFSQTPTSALSIEAFFSVEYTEEQDPPAYTNSMKQNEEKVQDLSDGALKQITLELEELERRIDTQIQKLSDKSGSHKFFGQVAKTDFASSKGLQYLMNNSSTPSNQELATQSGSPSDPKETSKTLYARDMLRNVLDGLVEPEILETCVDDLHILTQHSGSKMCELLSEAEEMRNLAELGGDKPPNKCKNNDDLKDSSKDLVNDPNALGDNSGGKLPLFIPSAIPTKSENSIIDQNDGTLYVDDIDDEELDREYILQPKEVMLKAAIWFKENGEFLEKLRRRFNSLPRIILECTHYIERDIDG